MTGNQVTALLKALLEIREIMEGVNESGYPRVNATEDIDEVLASVQGVLEDVEGEVVDGGIAGGQYGLAGGDLAGPLSRGVGQR